MFAFSELDEMKQELESKLGSEFQNKLQRARSLSESTSESEVPTAGAGTIFLLYLLKDWILEDMDFST